MAEINWTREWGVPSRSNHLGKGLMLKLLSKILIFIYGLTLLFIAYNEYVMQGMHFGPYNKHYLPYQKWMSGVLFGFGLLIFFSFILVRINYKWSSFILIVSGVVGLIILLTPPWEGIMIDQYQFFLKGLVLFLSSSTFCFGVTNFLRRQ